MNLFCRILGDEYHTLPEAVKKLHETDKVEFSGNVSVSRGGFLSRLVSAPMKLSPAVENSPMQFSIDQHQHQETWRRKFGDAPMVSTLSHSNGLLVEKLGPLRCHFDLRVVENSIVWAFVKASFLGIRLPSFLFKTIVSREYAVGDVYHFDVKVVMHLVGLVIAYSGWLEV